MPGKSLIKSVTRQTNFVCLEDEQEQKSESLVEERQSRPTLQISTSEKIGKQLAVSAPPPLPRRHTECGPGIELWQGGLRNLVTTRLGIRDLTAREVSSFRFRKTDPVIRGLFGGELNSRSVKAVLDRFRGRLRAGTLSDQVGAHRFFIDLLRKESKNFYGKESSSPIRKYYLELAQDVLERFEQNPERRDHLRSLLDMKDLFLICRYDQSLVVRLQKLFDKDTIMVALTLNDDHVGSGALRRMVRKYLDDAFRRFSDGEVTQSYLSWKIRDEAILKLCCTYPEEPESTQTLFDWMGTIERDLTGNDLAKRWRAVNQLKYMLTTEAAPLVRRYAEYRTDMALKDTSSRPLKALLPREFLQIELGRIDRLYSQVKARLAERVALRGDPRDRLFLREALIRFERSLPKEYVQEYSQEGLIRYATLSGTNPVLKLQTRFASYRLDQTQIRNYTFSLRDPVIKGILKGKLDRPSTAIVMGHIRKYMNLGGYAAILARSMFDAILERWDASASLRNFYLDIVDDMVRRFEHCPKEAATIAKALSDEELWLVLHHGEEVRRKLDGIVDPDRMKRVSGLGFEEMRKPNRARRDALISAMLVKDFDRLCKETVIPSRFSPGYDTEEFFRTTIELLPLEPYPQALYQWIGKSTRDLYSLNMVEAIRAERRLRSLTGLRTRAFLEKFAERLVTEAVQKIGSKGESLQERVPPLLLEVELRRRRQLGKSALEALHKEIVRKGTRDDQLYFQALRSSLPDLTRKEKV